MVSDLNMTPAASAAIGDHDWKLNDLRIDFCRGLVASVGVSPKFKWQETGGPPVAAPITSCPVVFAIVTRSLGDRKCHSLHGVFDDQEFNPESHHADRSSHYRQKNDDRGVGAAQRAMFSVEVSAYPVME